MIYTLDFKTLGTGERDCHETSHAGQSDVGQGAVL